MASDALVEGVAGGVGSALALLATYPLKTLYTVQALEAERDGKAALSVLDILRRYRLTELFVGLEPSLVETAASSGIYFYLYSKLRAYAVRQGGKKAMHPAQAAPAGDTEEISGGSARRCCLRVVPIVLDGFAWLHWQ